MDTAHVILVPDTHLSASAPQARANWDAVVTTTGAELAGAPPGLVMSGHVHQYRLLRLDGTEHLWVPATWAVLPDHVQPVFGAKRCGIVSLSLTSRAHQELIEPGGLEQHTLTIDLPHPYPG